MQKIMRPITSGAFLIILFVIACNVAINGSILPVQTSKALAAVQDNNDNVETVYLKFVSQALKESNANTSSGTSNNRSSVSSATQVPVAAKGPTISAKGYLVQQIRDHLYWVTDGSYNTMFLVTDKGVVAVDAPPTIGKNYLKAIAEVTNKPVTYVIYSHAHLDHIGAAGMFPRNATFIAQNFLACHL